MKSQDPSGWSAAEFRVFLLVHASHADLDYSLTERTYILGFIAEEELKEIEHFYRLLGEYEIIQFLQKAKPNFFPTIEKKEALMAEIAKLIAADNRVSSLEIHMLNFLNRIL